MTEKDAGIVSLSDMIKQFMWFQHSKNEERGFTMPEIEHALFLFGGWDTFDVGREVAHLVETGELERSLKFGHRWKKKQ